MRSCLRLRAFWSAFERSCCTSTAHQPACSKNRAVTTFPQAHTSESCCLCCSHTRWQTPLARAVRGCSFRGGARAPQPGVIVLCRQERSIRVNYPGTSSARPACLWSAAAAMVAPCASAATACPVRSDTCHPFTCRPQGACADPAGMRNIYTVRSPTRTSKRKDHIPERQPWRPVVWLCRPCERP